ncbi:MAG TPA: hypothetical protein VH501_09465 [Solirubrobacterales bacterium]|jgi:hypothetical protein
MYARVVRFTDVDPERIAAIQQRIEENDGPPEGVVSTGLKLLFDESQSTAVFVGFFDSEENMRRSAGVLEAMDPADTPGTRASVDMCEVKVEADA